MATLHHESADDSGEQTSGENDDRDLFSSPGDDDTAISSVTSEQDQLDELDAEGAGAGNEQTSSENGDSDADAAVARSSPGGHSH